MPDNPDEAALARRLEALYTWEQLLPRDRLDFLLNEPNPTQWFTDTAMATLAHFRDDAQTWGEICAMALNIHLSPGRLEAAVDAWRELTRPRDEDVEGTRFPFVDLSSHAPTLPGHLRLERPQRRTWLDDYVDHSAYWGPRAAPSYHRTVGLWILSTIAARRIVCHMGPRDVYPTLFLALISSSGLWTKTEAASIGLKMLRRAGCGHLLSPDRTTPQFLLKFMTGHVPDNYGRKSVEEQEHLQHSLAFAAQRGWFYEEWGNMLKQMRRADSPQSELNKLLIVLEGGAESFETGTIQRGLERVVQPYLALLGCATPRDLAPFMGEGDAWWHDGFWPRFAFAVPDDADIPSRIPRPRELHTIPGALIVPLSNWYQRLGVPAVSITEEREMNGKSTGKWTASISGLPCETLTLASEVYDAYEAYNDALLVMVQEGQVSSDLAAWYVRAHEKALRVAMLLTSLHGETCITLPYWAEGQVMAEQWRRNMHALCSTVASQTPLTPELRLEQRILTCLTRSGGMTKRELQRTLSGVTSESLVKTLQHMVKAEIITEKKHGKRSLYLFSHDDEKAAEE